MKRLMSLWVALAAIAAVLGQHAAAAPPPLPTREELEGLLNAFDVPGIAMASLTNCELDGQSLVAGHASLNPAKAVTAATVFEAASLSKPVFAWLVLQLAEEKIIDLDRPMAETFGYARIPDKAAYAKLTPRMVLTHRTGLPNWVDESTYFHRRVAPIPFKSPPGTVYSYSGEAFQLLQAFVEKKTGRTLAALFHARLGRWMPNSTFVNPLARGTVPSRGYRSAKRPDSGRDMTNLSERAMAASSLVTTAEDYARFLSLVCKGEGLSRAAYDDMLRAQSPVPPGESPFPTSYGLGWAISDLGGTTLVSHNGNNGEYRAFAGFIRESRDGIVILTNGANGQALIDALIQPPSSRKEGLSLPEAVFEEFWAIYNEGYALFGVKHVDWDAVYRVYRPRVSPSTKDDELWALMGEVIGLLNDVHVSVRDPKSERQVRSGGRSIGVGPFDNGEFSLDLVAKTYAVRGLQSAADGAIHYGWLPGEIGYLHIGRFRDLDASARATDQAIAALKNAKGLLLDVRNNGGGDDRVGQAIASRFVVAARPYMTVAMRRPGRVPPAFLDPVEWRLAPAGPLQFTRPIVLLVNSRSISAAENFALALRAVPQAIIVGETTAGAMADIVTRVLPNDWQVTVPINLFRDVNGVSWEGVGITPDLWVKNERSEVASGTDRALQMALEFLRAGVVVPRDRYRH
ncbi:MAG TPA: serine hydrolase [Steroidobacteraceae bacterium]|nr:serine hydrolase [Steroidobacteraceae bacterium]